MVGTRFCELSVLGGTMARWLLQDSPERHSTLVGCRVLLDGRPEVVWEVYSNTHFRTKPHRWWFPYWLIRARLKARRANRD